MGISLCLIVKNEEDWIAGAFGSVRSIVDEVIILDSGSTDSPPDLIRSLCAKTVDLKWNDSFADARKASLAKPGSPGSWSFSRSLEQTPFLQNDVEALKGKLSTWM